MACESEEVLESKIEMEDRVNVYKYGDMLELATVPKKASPIEVKKIDKDHYKKINHATGEVDILEYQRHSKSRADNIPFVLRSMRNLRRIINANEWDNQLWLTLTYAENQKDTKQVYKDFQVFIKDLRRKVDCKLEYINVLEPQERGAWHCHVLLRSDDVERLYIPNEVVAKCWKKGFTKTKAIKETDNVAAYLTAYLTSFYDEEEKRSIKGSRLIMYPPGMNIFRCSRGINRPTEIKNVSKQTAMDTFDKDLSNLTYVSNKKIDLQDMSINYSLEIYD